MKFQDATAALQHATFEEIQKNRIKIQPHIVKTPVFPWNSPIKDRLFGSETEIYIKLEHLQHGGSFKIRGGLTVLQELTPEQKKKGVVAVTAGNHGIATAYVCKMLGIQSQIFLPEYANPYKTKRIKDLGAKVYRCKNLDECFSLSNEVSQKEGAFFHHPFDGFGMSLGHGSIVLEMVEQIGPFDRIYVPVGGGGFASGIGNCAKQHPSLPSVQVITVEPEGAPTYHKAIANKGPISVAPTTSIADSLCAPQVTPYVYHQLKRVVDKSLLVRDKEIVEALRMIMEDFRFMVEPACGVSMAGAIKDREELKGKKIVLVFCGSNIDPATWLNQVGNDSFV